MLPLISPANIDFVKRKSNTPPSDFSVFYEDLMFLITAVANTGRTFPAKPWKIPLLDVASEALSLQNRGRCLQSGNRQVRGQSVRDVAARSTCTVIAGDRTFRR